MNSRTAASEPGGFGLVKFRNPGAEFRNLRFGDDIPDTRLPRSLVAKVDRLLEGKELDVLPPLGFPVLQRTFGFWRTDPQGPP